MAVQSIGCEDAGRLILERAAGPALLPAARSPMRLSSDRSPAPALVVEVRSLAEMAAMRDAWTALSVRALETNVFYEPAFVLAAGRHLGAQPARFAAVRQGEALLGLFPLAQRRPGLSRGWSMMFTPYGAPLVDRERAQAVLSAYLHWMRGESGGMLFPQIDVDGPFGLALRVAADRGGSPLSRLDEHRRAALLPGDGSALSPRRAKEMRRLAKRLGETGALRVERATTPPDVAAALTTFLALERMGWKGRAGSALASQPGTEAFVQGMTTDLAAAGGCRIDVLYAGSTPVAAGIVLRSGGRASFWKIAYDERFARFSPGVLLTLDLIEAQHACGAALTDSCAIADHPMIDALWPSRIAVADIAVGSVGRDLRFRLDLALETTRRRLRATAKRAYLLLRRKGAPKRPAA